MNPILYSGGPSTIDHEFRTSRFIYEKPNLGDNSRRWLKALWPSLRGFVFSIILIWKSHVQLFATRVASGSCSPWEGRYRLKEDFR